MTKPKNEGKRSRYARVGTVMLAAAATAAAVVAASALANTHTVSAPRSAHRANLTVFKHHRRVARVDSASKAPAGAILAASTGKTDVYVARNANGDDCVYHFTAGAAGGGGCSPAAQVEGKGAVGIFQEGEGATAPGSPATLRVTALVPNGVSSVEFTDKDGSSYSVPVTNNVAVHEDIDISKVSYTLSDDATETTDVAAVVDRTPRQPGAPGSSR
jgi:hypothetical protein